MPTVQFRPATIVDAEALVRLRLEFLAEATPEHAAAPGLADAMHRYLLDALPTGEFVAHLALAQDAVVATSGVLLRRHPPSARNPSGRSAYILNMYTVPAWRGKGLASELLRRCLDSARTDGCHRLTLHTVPAARSLYTRFGFTPGDSEMCLNL